MVPGRLAHLVEVVVLAAGADALLRRNGSLVIAFFISQKHVFELIHPRVREKQRRVVGRQQRRRMHAFVSVPLKILEEFLSNLISGHTKTLTQTN